MALQMSSKDIANGPQTVPQAQAPEVSTRARDSSAIASAGVVDDLGN